MKTIEERTKEYAPDAFMPDEILPAREGHLVNLERRGYVAGATEEHELLTKWRKPNDPPKPHVHVLIKYEKPIVTKDSDVAYAIGYCQFSDSWRFVDEKYHQALDTFGYKFVGWREIHE